MEQPRVCWFVVGGSGKVCKLKNYINELKQSPWTWLVRLHLLSKILDFLVPNGSLGFFRQLQGERTFLVVHVDYIVITDDDAQGIVNMKQYLTLKVSRQKALHLCNTS